MAVNQQEQLRTQPEQERGAELRVGDCTALQYRILAAEKNPDVLLQDNLRQVQLQDFQPPGEKVIKGAKRLLDESRKKFYEAHSSELPENQAEWDNWWRDKLTTQIAGISYSKDKNKDIQTFYQQLGLVITQDERQKRGDDSVTVTLASNDKTTVRQAVDTLSGRYFTKDSNNFDVFMADAIKAVIGKTEITTEEELRKINQFLPRIKNFARIFGQEPTSEERDDPAELVEAFVAARVVFEYASHNPISIIDVPPSAQEKRIGRKLYDAMQIVEQETTTPANSSSQNRERHIAEELSQLRAQQEHLANQTNREAGRQQELEETAAILREKEEEFERLREKMKNLPSSERKGQFSVGSESIPSKNHPDRNEDAVMMNDQKGYLGVFDGNGGMGNGGGTFASDIAKENFESELESLSQPTVAQIIEAYKRGWKKAKEALRAFETAHPEHKDLGTTVTIAQVVKEGDQAKIVVGHSGDSRLYLVKQDGTASQITTDHDYIYQQQRDGYITAKEADEAREELNQAQRESDLTSDVAKAAWAVHGQIANRLGAEPDTPSGARNIVDESNLKIDTFDLSKDVKQVIGVTDGVYDNLTEDQIKEIMGYGMANAESVDDIAANLVTAARAVADKQKNNDAIRPKPDDISAAVLALA